MDFTESFLAALDSLTVNKLRAALTTLGVVIGVGAVIALISLGNGVNASVTDQIQSIGVNLLSISTDFEKTSYDTLTMSDVRALEDPSNTPSITQVSAVVDGAGEAIYKKNNQTVSLLGVSANYFAVSNLDDVALGSLFTQSDVDARARVAVLGSTIASNLFEDVYPIGQSVKISGEYFKVIGVLAESGGAQFNRDEQIFIPISTAQSRVMPFRTRQGQPAVSQIMVTASSAETTDSAIREITNTLRRTHNIAYAGDDDFRIFSQNDLLETAATITATLTLFLGAIAGISLLVGGIGIMNIMLVSVTERTREIGVRKAIGALRRDILAQFLIEALVLSLLGGLLGTLLGAGAASLASLALSINPVIDVGTVLLANGFAAAVGLVFGIYPAWRAAKLRPIEALRYE